MAVCADVNVSESEHASLIDVRDRCRRLSAGRDIKWLRIVFIVEIEYQVSAATAAVAESRCNSWNYLPRDSRVFF